jgi:hypothetical protein
MKNLKILGLALVAVFAMSAVVASAASATVFRSESTPTVLTGTQKAGTNDVFNTMGGTVTCENATYVGSVSGTSSTEAEVEPTYSGCTAFGFANVTIDVNKCKYKFTAGSIISGNFEGSVHIVCPEKPIEVTAPGCTITVATQTPTGGTITYTNLGSGTTRELGVDVALTGIHYIEDNKGLFPTCSSPGVTTTDGTYRGESIVKGENEAAEQHGIWVE